MKFRQEDVMKMAERRGWIIRAVAENTYVLRKQGEPTTSNMRVNGAAAVQSMAPVYYRFVTKKRDRNV